MKKKLTCLSLVLFIVLSISSCSRNQDNEIKPLGDNHVAEIENDVEVFSEGDISQITERVFGSVSTETPGEGTNNGIIADLFANAEVQICSVDESTISYTIISPDISDFFTVCAEQLDSIRTSQELGQAILEYAKTAPQKEYTVTVYYSVEDNNIDVAYDNPDFINAMTGGLLDAYADLYNQYLEEKG